MNNSSDFVLLPSDYQYYMSVAVHDHILNSILSVFIMAFLIGFGFGFFSITALEYIRKKQDGQK